MEKVPKVSQLLPACFQFLDWDQTFRCCLYPRARRGEFSPTYSIIQLIYSTTVASVSAEERSDIFSPTVSLLTLSPAPPHTVVCINQEQITVIPPNVVVVWLALLLRIRVVPGSNLGPETGYTD
jgi:hypothetical protein